MLICSYVAMSLLKKISINVCQVCEICASDYIEIKQSGIINPAILLFRNTQKNDAITIPTCNQLIRSVTHSNSNPIATSI